eukprot:Skav215273  [mRNA]  locus=scaffold2881:205994:206852:- [translate_table: standard]
MDATMQINAFGLSAGCTFSLDNVPNQLAVLGHFRAMLEMCLLADSVAGRGA